MNPQISPMNLSDNYGLSENQIAEFQQLFSSFDHQKKNQISSQDLPSLIKALGQYWTKTELDELIKEVNTEHNGYLNFENFLKIMTRKVKPGEEENEEKHKDVYKLMENIDEGPEKMNVKELKKIIMGLGENVTEEEVDEMIQEVGVDENGDVKYREFLKSLLSK